MSEPLTIRLYGPANTIQLPPAALCSWPDVRSEYAPENGLSLVRSGNAGVRLLWWIPGHYNRGERTFTLHLARNPSFSPSQTFPHLRMMNLELKDLLLGEQYFWKVTAFENDREVAESETWSFTTHPQPPRWLSLHDIVNLRDAGGWPLCAGGRVRQGMVYRSGELNSRQWISEEAHRFLTDTLGIRSDIDLRNTSENPVSVLAEDKVGFLWASIDAYAGIELDWSQEGYRRIFAHLANPASYPVLIHCVAGADRTGTLIFLLNALLGVGEEDLYHDYELTTLSGLGVRLRDTPYFQEFLRVLRGYAPAGAPVQEQATACLLAMGIPRRHLDAVCAILREAPAA